MSIEKARMLAGELYRPSDPVLVAERRNAARLAARFNAADTAAERGRWLAQLLGGLGADSLVVPQFHCDYGYNVTLGARVFINCGCVFLDCCPIVIGDDAKIGPAVQIYTATHPLDAQVRRTGVESAAPVAIGANAWIGGGAILCPGVTIGADAVVGAGSVVTRDVPAGIVAAGNPCRALR